MMTSLEAEETRAQTNKLNKIYTQLNKYINNNAFLVYNFIMMLSVWLLCFKRNVNIL